MIDINWKGSLCSSPSPKRSITRNSCETEAEIVYRVISVQPMGMRMRCCIPRGLYVM